jgi:hypothetical protein
VEQLGANTHGEVQEAGRVPDCYLGLRLSLQPCSVSNLGGRGVHDRPASRPVNRGCPPAGAPPFHAAAVAGR